MQVEPMNPVSGTVLSKLRYDGTLSNFAFTFNLRRYSEASDIVKKGKMSALFINDLDAGAGRMGGSTQYTAGP